MFEVIYADPPWPYNDKQRNRPPNYARMTLAELAALPVAAVSAPDAALFLWTTCPMLNEALTMMSCWGFDYKTVGFVWVKVRKDGSGQPALGMGHYTRSNVELCLLGTRGSPHVRRHDVGQVVVGRRREHSRKPDEARDRLVQLMGDVPRLEMFARGVLPEGWSGHGDEYTGSDPVDLSNLGSVTRAKATSSPRELG